MVIRRSTGISTKTGPGRPVSAVRIAVVSTSGICRVSATVHEPLVIGREERDLLGLLERAQPAQAERRRAADQEQRAPRRVRVGDTGDGVGDAGPGGDHGHADIAGEPRVGVAGMGARLLVAHVDDRDALGEAAVVDRQDVAAAEREDDGRRRPA